MRMQLRFSCRASLAALAIFTTSVMAPCELALASNWLTNGGGDYHNAPDWSAGVPNTAGAISDFSTLDFSGDNSITMNAAVTVGQMSFGDTNNAATPSSWELRSDSASVLTLNNSGVAPIVNVNPLGVTGGGFDDAFIGVPVASTLGLTKTGAGTLTFNAPTTISGGNYTISGGHLRFLSPATQSVGLPIVMASGTTLSIPFSFPEIAASGGGTVTVNQTSAATNQFMVNVHGAGTGESLVMNLNGGNTTTHSLDRDWGAANGAWANVTFNGIGNGVSGLPDNDPLTAPFNLRARINTGGGNAWNGASFTNTAVTLNNARWFTLTNSGGNTITFGSLSGNIDAVLAGGSGGTAARFQIGGLNTDTTYAGLLDGTGGLTINKVGTGKLTLSGGVNAVSPVRNDTDPGRQGGVVRVTSGILATSGTFNNFASGIATINATVDIKPGATLDVTGSSSFHSVPFQQFIGAGTIKGNFNHQAGNINPADTGVVDNDTDLTNVLVRTAGTITFDGNLSFNGGAIVYDMGATPGTDDLVSVTGSTNLGSGGIVKPSFLAGVPAAGQVYTFLNSAGGFTGTTTGWSVQWPGRGAAPTVSVVGNALQFTSAPVIGGATLVWSGATNGTWDINATQNWTNGGSPDKYYDGDNVQFTETGTNTTINIPAAVTPLSMVVDSTTKNYSFSGSPILGATTLVKRGSSTLTMGMNNLYTGNTTIEAGTVNTGAFTALGTGILELQSNTTLTRTGGLTNSSININGTGVTINNDAAGDEGTPALTGNGTVTFTSITSAKTLSTNASNTFTGTVNFVPAAGGTLGIRAGGANADFPTAVVNMTSTTFSNRNGGTGTAVFSFGELHGDAASALTAFGGGSAPPNANFEIGGLGTNSDFAGTINDGTGASLPSVASVTKIGAGTLSLTAFNTYTGDTRVDGGTLSLSLNYLADLADVYIASSSVLDLTHSTTDIIDSLYLGNIPQNPGTYGAVGSAATFQSAFFSGTGILQVTTLGAPLATPGDFDLDGDVDGRDFLIWQRGGSTTGPLNATDLANWQTNYGTGVGPLTAASIAVPEPAGLMLVVMASLFVANRRRS